MKSSLKIFHFGGAFARTLKSKSTFFLFLCIFGMIPKIVSFMCRNPILSGTDNWKVDFLCPEIDRYTFLSLCIHFWFLWLSYILSIDALIRTFVTFLLYTLIIDFQGWPSSRSKSEVVSAVDCLLAPSLFFYILWYFSLCSCFWLSVYFNYQLNFSYCILCWQAWATGDCRTLPKTEIKVTIRVVTSKLKAKSMQVFSRYKSKFYRSSILRQQKTRSAQWSTNCCDRRFHFLSLLLRTLHWRTQV